MRVVEHVPSHIHCRHRCDGDEKMKTGRFPRTKSTGFASPIVIVTVLATSDVRNDERLCSQCPDGGLDSLMSMSSH